MCVCVGVCTCNSYNFYIQIYSVKYIPQRSSIEF